MIVLINLTIHVYIDKEEVTPKELTYRPTQSTHTVYYLIRQHINILWNGKTGGMSGGAFMQLWFLEYVA